MWVDAEFLFVVLVEFSEYTTLMPSKNLRNGVSNVGIFYLLMLSGDRL